MFLSKGIRNIDIDNVYRAESVSYQYIFQPISIFLPGPNSHTSVELKNVDYCVGIINPLTGIIIFENSWKIMDTMDRIPCCSVSMLIKHFKLGQAIDHICGIKTQITYRHSPP